MLWPMIYKSSARMDLVLRCYEEVCELCVFLGCEKKG